MNLKSLKNLILVISLVINCIDGNHPLFGAQMMSLSTGLSSGTIIQLQPVDTTVTNSNTGTSTTTTAYVQNKSIYSGLFLNLNYGQDLSGQFVSRMGGEFVNLGDSTSSVNVMRKSVYFGVDYLVFGGPHLVKTGTDTMNVQENARRRIGIPLYMTYDSIDFSTQSDTAITKYQGGMFSLESGLRISFDILSDKFFDLFVLSRFFRASVGSDRLTHTDLNVGLSYGFYY